MRQLIYTVSASLGLLGMLVSCGFQADTNSPAPLAQNAVSGIGCSNLKAKIWDGLFAMARESRRFATPADVRAAMTQELASQSRLSPGDQDTVTEAVVQIYETLILHPDFTEAKTQKDVEGFLAMMEVGDQSTPEKKAAQQALRSAVGRIKQLAQATGQACSAPGGGNPGAGGGGGAPNGGGSGSGAGGNGNSTGSSGASALMLDQWRAKVAAPVYGAWLSMSTAYQSCSAVSIGALDSTVADIQGVDITGRYSDGNGYTRKISDVTKLVQTDIYYSQYQMPAAGCFDVTKNPLIYNYGGKPNASSSAGSDLDFHTNAGTGSETLGVDCSGFVFTANASVGYKLSTDAPLRAIQVQSFPARAYAAPADFGLDCFSPIKVAGKLGESSLGPVFDPSQPASPTPTGDLQPGDVIATTGHIVMVDTVQADPFGIGGFKTDADCTAQNIKAAGFNFTIIQSSPAKGGIGIDRMPASYYFTSSPGSMSKGLEAYALAACHARFVAPSQPSGLTATVVRHVNSAQCMDTAVALRRNSCVQSCSLQPRNSRSLASQ